MHYFRDKTVLQKSMGLLVGGWFLPFLLALDVFLAGVAQAALAFCLAAATALLGVFLTICKIVVSHIINYELHEPLARRSQFY